ncbi:MAG: hypothetical protein WBB37_06735 [bacterium]
MHFLYSFAGNYNYRMATTSAGVYFYRLTTEYESAIGKLILVNFYEN